MGGDRISDQMSWVAVEEADIAALVYEACKVKKSSFLKTPINLERRSDPPELAKMRQTQTSISRKQKNRHFGSFGGNRSSVVVSRAWRVLTSEAE